MAPAPPRPGAAASAAPVPAAPAAAAHAAAAHAADEAEEAADPQEAPQRLALTNQRLKSIPQRVIEHFSKIETLDFSGNRLQNFESLTAFKRLRSLILERNGIRHVHHLPRMPSVTTLWLSFNLLADLDLVTKDLAQRFPNLRSLSLSQNPCSPDLDASGGDSRGELDRYRRVVAAAFPRLEVLDDQKLHRFFGAGERLDALSDLAHLEQLDPAEATRLLVASAAPGKGAVPASIAAMEDKDIWRTHLRSHRDLDMVFFAEPAVRLESLNIRLICVVLFMFASFVWRFVSDHWTVVLSCLFLYGILLLGLHASFTYDPENVKLTGNLLKAWAVWVCVLFGGHVLAGELADIAKSRCVSDLWPDTKLPDNCEAEVESQLLWSSSGVLGFGILAIVWIGKRFDVFLRALLPVVNVTVRKIQQGTLPLRVPPVLTVRSSG